MKSMRTNGEVPAGGRSRPISSLTTRILARIAFFSAVAVSALSFLAYSRAYEVATEAKIEELKAYVSARVRADSSIFGLAEDNLRVFGREFLRLYNADVPVSEEEFWSYYFVDPEGATRMKRVFFDGLFTPDGRYVYGLSSFVGNNQSVDDPDFRRRLVLAAQVLAALGPAWVDRFANVHAAYPENGITLFYPTEPWGLNARADLPMNELGVIRAVNAAENPQRKPVWSGLYYDETAEEWMVTYMAPVDQGGRHLITPGHDIYLSDLMDRLAEKSADGAYNFIIRDDGYLVAHPSGPTDEQKWIGQLSLDKIDLPSVKESFRLIRDSGNYFDEAAVIENAAFDSYLAVERLKGPNWYFVRVLPRATIRTAASAAAARSLWEGGLILGIMLLIVYLVMRSQAKKPLRQLTLAAESIGRGDYGAVADRTIPVPVETGTEIGLLSTRFVEMATSIRDSQMNLQRIVEERTLELERANAKLVEMSLLDGLTGIHNRRSLDRSLARLFSDAEAGLGSFSIMMIDVDFFKKYNDAYGHAEGDEVLRRVARTLENSIREGDRAFRYGGEEFVVIFAHADPGTAAVVAERVMQAVRDLRIVHAESPYGIVTISAGLGSYGTHASPGDLIRDADEKLYRAKSGGRNRLER